jgi:hypothetical protein
MVDLLEVFLHGIVVDLPGVAEHIWALMGPAALDGNPWIYKGKGK